MKKVSEIVNRIVASIQLGGVRFSTRISLGLECFN